jgi:enterochelin esterase-like enzyme
MAMVFARFCLLLLFFLFAFAGFCQTPVVNKGSIVRIDSFVSPHVVARHIDVWLPPGYTPSQRYAVVYMHDGQMLFDSTYTWNHQEWGVDETLGKLIENKEVEPVIVVGIHNTPERRREFWPNGAWQLLSPDVRDSVLQALHAPNTQSDNYLKFIVKSLKPHIDSAFATKTDAASTFLMGSSMGGLISMYGICEYPEVFGGAICMSTHWVGFPLSLKEQIAMSFHDYLLVKMPNESDHRFYFDYGDQTLDAHYDQAQQQIDELFWSMGWSQPEAWMSKFFPGADHSEKSWRSRLHEPFLFMLGE